MPPPLRFGQLAEGAALDQYAQALYGITRLQARTEEIVPPMSSGQTIRAVPAETDEELRQRIYNISAGPPPHARVNVENGAVTSITPLPTLHGVGRPLQDGDPLQAWTLNAALGWVAFNDGQDITAGDINAAIGETLFLPGDMITASRINEGIARAQQRARRGGLDEDEWVSRVQEEVRQHLYRWDYDPRQLDITIGGVKFNPNKIRAYGLDDFVELERKTAWCRLLEDDTFEDTP
jgi:hypothetical protein